MQVILEELATRLTVIEKKLAELESKSPAQTEEKFAVAAKNIYDAIRQGKCL